MHWSFCIAACDLAARPKRAGDTILRRFLRRFVPLTLAACATLPGERSVTPSHALTDTAETTLGRHAERILAGLQGPTGVRMLSRGQDAFLARLVLAEKAERSLDAQYFIWHGDDTGRLLIAAFLRAADRGVRVRVLIDDVGSAANDTNLLLLDRHSNVEVRLFNPLASRSARSLGMLFDFARTNRRMHNKSFTADNQITIVGGRTETTVTFQRGTDGALTGFDLTAGNDYVTGTVRYRSLTLNAGIDAERFALTLPKDAKINSIR